MPTWTLIHPDGKLEHVEADSCERTRTGWDWSKVVVIIDSPRWACIRRVSRTDVIGEPLPTVGPSTVD